LINLDFADVRTVMSGMGTAMMGTGEATGDRRATIAAEEAIANPLLDDVSLRGAKGLLLSITGGPNLTLYEVDEAASRVRQEVDSEANIIVGATFDETLDDRVRVSIVASGMMRTGESERDKGLPFDPNVARTRSELAGRRAEDVQRRLSDALQENAGMVSYRGVEPAAPAADEPSAPKKEIWRAPGNVVIEEGPPQLAPGGNLPPPLPGAFADPVAGIDNFTPASTTEIRRPLRRMPEVEDFPPIGQREYLAKTGGAGEGRPSTPQPERRRQGLLERIVARVRREGDSQARAAAAPPSPPKEMNAAPAARQKAHYSDVGRRVASGSQPSTQDAELPVFFSREQS
jgi:cell division protein FtsZ